MKNLIKNRVKRYFEKIIKKRATIGNLFYLKLHYALFTNVFDRQILSISEGIKAYHQKNLDNDVLLTRNIHRLEKGLIMPNLRREYAMDYIEETVKAYMTIINAKRDKDINLISYASNVLDKYFISVNLKNPLLKILSEQFYSIDFKKENKFPYKRSQSEINEINFESLKKLYQQRRSVRFYLDKKVERNLIEKAVNIASLSPSACNRQPFKLFIADKDPARIEMGKLPPGAATYYQNVPVFIAIIGDLSSYFDERDKNLIYIDGSLFAMSLMLALETLGIASCSINWPDILSKEQQLINFLELKPYERCIMFLGIGYADPNSLIPYSNKKTSHQLIKYIS